MPAFFGIDEIELEIDSAAPYLRNRVPAPGAPGISRTANIVLEIYDDLSDVDKNESVLHVNRGAGAELAHTFAGGFEPDFDGPASLFEELLDGAKKYYRITIDPIIPLPYNETIIIGVAGADVLGNIMIPPDTSYDFDVERDDTPPYLRAWDPVPGAPDVPRNTSPSLEIADLLVDVGATTIVIDVDRGAGVENVYTHPNFASGWLGSSIVEGLESGRKYYTLVLDPADHFAPDIDVTFYLTAADSLGNVLTAEAYGFHTAIVSPPIISALVPTGTDVPRNAVIGFLATDGDGCDPASVQMSVNGVAVVVDSVPATGWGLSVTGAPSPVSVVLTPASLLPFDEDYEITVTIADIYGDADTELWNFTTVRGLIVGPVLTSAAFGGLVRLLWTLPPAEDMRQERYLLRRSVYTAPTSPDEGKLVYEGLDRTFDDTDVINDVVYHYTLFVIRKYVGGQPVFVAYSPEASTTAKPHAPSVSRSRDREYVPTTSELGTVVNPMPTAHVASVWGVGGRQSEVLATVVGTPVFSPLAGTLVATSPLTIINDAGIGVRMTNVDVQTLAGKRVAAGQIIGRASAATVDVAVYKTPGDGYGRRAIRNRYLFGAGEP